MFERGVVAVPAVSVTIRRVLGWDELIVLIHVRAAAAARDGIKRFDDDFLAGLARGDVKSRKPVHQLMARQSQPVCGKTKTKSL
jgi:hypothetical protein